MASTALVDFSDIGEAGLGASAASPVAGLITSRQAYRGMIRPTKAVDVVREFDGWGRGYSGHWFTSTYREAARCIPREFFAAAVMIHA